jgi:hypothetical protein
MSYHYLSGLSLTPEQLNGFQGNLPYSKSAKTFLEPYAQSSITRSGTPYGLADPRYAGGKLLARRSRRVKSKSRRTKSKSRGTRRR